jgi:hypothetical protein
VVARIGLESGVSAVSWEVLGGDGDDLECAHIPLARGDGGSIEAAA